MTIAEFHADLKETNRLLARLCEAVEFAAGMKPHLPREHAKQAGLQDVSRISNIGMVKAEQERDAQRENPFRGGRPHDPAEV
jgi:hypothetical protein